MTADDIEFFVSDELPPDEFGQREEIGGRPRTRPPIAFSWVTAAAVILLAAAAALPAVASFRTVYTVHQGGAGQGSSLDFGVDGWGRLQEDSARLDPLSGVHEARYGIALVTCAGVLALLAVVVLATLLPGPARRAAPRVRQVAALVALVTSAGLAGVAAVVALQIQSIFDSLNAQFASFTSGGNSSDVQLRTGIGACLWLTLGGVVTALLAARALYHARHSSDRE